MSRRAALLLLLPLTAGLLFAWPGCSDAPDPGPPSAGFAEEMLKHIRQPSENQFANPESVVRFLIEQVKRRDAAEATKAFPIRERYRAETLASHAEYLRMFLYHQSPVPGATFHNLNLALADLETYDQLGLIFLGVDPNRRRILDENDVTGDVEELKAKLDHSKLMKLKIESITADEPAEVAAGESILKALGATRQATVTAAVTCEGVSVRCTFGCVKVGGNWRVRSLLMVDGLENDTWRTKTPL